MERVLLKQASAGPLLSPPPQLSSQFSAPLHSSTSSNPPLALIHQPSSCSPHYTHTHLLKHGTPNKAAHDAVAANSTAMADVDALATPSENSVGPAILVDSNVPSENSGSFTQSVVRPPLSCELDMATAKSRNSLLASLSAYIAEDMVTFSGAEGNGPTSVKMAENLICGIQENGESHQNRTEQTSTDEQRNECTEVQAEKELQKQRQEVGGAPVLNWGHVAIGLKLGKRSYFGDSGAGRAKKSKASLPVVNRCQAEDCKIDLTGAKEYYRRHKVCEWHSKSSKVRVANLDQRFCQQCSRFHMLTAFDEGKRSCRRRLAGHNERRRKQQPEPFPLLSAASYSYFTGAKHLCNPSLFDCQHFFEHERAEAEFKGLQKPKLEPVENYQQPSELPHFMQASQRADGQLLLGGSAQALVLSGGNGTNLGRPPSPLTTMTACLVPDHPQPSPETLVSGRALSLLSSSLGFPNTSNSVSMALGVSSPSFEGCILENHHGTSSHQITSRASSCFTSDVLKSIETLPLPHEHNINMLSGSESAAVTHCLSMNQVQPSTILSFGGSSTFPILHSDDGQSGSAQPMLDLMQVPFARAGTPRQQVEHQFTDLEGLSIFGRQTLL